ncbi:AraC family transcriptional regulator [Kaistella jeonii]|uniref:Regulatory protein n=1 Tax=Kaistella jeonii TaxID=266749 RepID=A0A0C1CPH1_9FLAO|nr:AraC family transcriptional regulator [Kaistella jeonii]KIA85961.1 regulatory protein [Kaistella jeonii]SFC38667.1 AraC-type DNA-binding protein [Kaistella jeonii]VEI96856.1 DNA-binding transcriptional regulator AraC [Kaistella jeonii]
MKTTLYIKNMVCNRCKSTVERELNALGYEVESLELGKVVLSENSPFNNSELEKILIKHGFEIIKDETEVLIEDIKIAVIKKIEDQDNENISAFLQKKFDKSYSALSKLFSKTEGMTIEKYEITLKIEKVKELIQLGQDNFSEIAYSLDYHNSSHLAKQFKNETGISMTEFKNLQNWDRKSLDGIV